jgi:hypothetical protein
VWDVTEDDGKIIVRCRPAMVDDDLRRYADLTG